MLNLEYLKNLNEQQKEAVSCLNGPLLIVAGAGSGKTKVLTSRIAHIIKQKKAFPNQIIAVTFTNKAAKEMQNRVSTILKKEAIGLSWLGTFHSISAKLLRKHAPAVGLHSNYSIIDQDDQVRLVKNICKAENIDIKKISPKYILSSIDNWKNKGWYPEDVILKKKDILKKGFLKIYKIYQSKLMDLNACDFGDLILHCVKIFEKNSDIRKLYSKNFKYILVDEYQDTNLIQSKWLNYLAEYNENICCVGDDDQSIYSWRGAEIKNFLKFDKIYENTKIIRLEKNYRSTQNILSVASKLIENNQNRVGKKLYTNSDNGELVSLNCYKNGKDEATGVGDQIEKLKKKHLLNNISILVRAIFQTREFEERFLKIGLPYRIIGGIKFYERAEIKDCIAYLRIIHQAQDDLSFERIINVPKRSIGDSAIKQINEYAKKNALPLEVASKKLLENNKIKPKTKIGLSSFLNLIEIHGSKGLEFDVVFLPGWEEGLFPHQKSIEEKGEKGLEEERRLAYVGITRSKKLVNISFSMNRFYQGDWIDSMASRFIDELPNEHLQKNNFFAEDQNNDFEFNQDIEFESENKSPGWIRYQKRIKIK